MPDDPKRRFVVRDYWFKIGLVFVIGYLTSFWVHLYLENFWGEIGIVGIMLIAGMVAAAFLAETQRREERRRENVERRKTPEPDPLEIDEDQASGDKLNTLHRIAKQVKTAFSTNAFTTCPAIPIDEYRSFLAERSCVVVHFWARWNGIDRQQDRELQIVRKKWEPQVCFVSCDTDEPASFDFAKEAGVANLPFVAIYAYGIQKEQMLGIHSADALNKILERVVEKTG